VLPVCQRIRPPRNDIDRVGLLPCPAPDWARFAERHGSTMPPKAKGPCGSPKGHTVTEITTRRLSEAILINWAKLAKL
jgi:hypothetical protein